MVSRFSFLNTHRSYSYSRGFTLLEVLLVIAILAVLFTGVGAFYGNYIKIVEFESVGKHMLFDMREARTYAMSGKKGEYWGVHAKNGVDDYYEIYSTPSDYSSGAKTIFSTVYLPGGISFTLPAEGLERDILFSRIFGTTTPAVLEVAFNNATTTITITQEGFVY